MSQPDARCAAALSGAGTVPVSEMHMMQICPPIPFSFLLSYLIIMPIFYYNIDELLSIFE
jgi:hypothetical protein